MDETGKEDYFIFWMLTAAGSSPQARATLVPGTYKCYAAGQYTFMDLSITGTDSYGSQGGKGKFRVEANNKIVFVSGPLSRYTSRLDAGPSIMLSTNGGSFYGTSCELDK
jgi:hypothetical protein